MAKLDPKWGHVPGALVVALGLLGTACVEKNALPIDEGTVGSTEQPLTAGSDPCTASVLVGSSADGLPPLKVDGSGPNGTCSDAVCGSSNCNNRCVIEELIKRVPDHGTVCFPSTQASDAGTDPGYSIGGTIHVSHPVTLRGQRTKLKLVSPAGSVPLILVDNANANDVHISGLRLEGQNTVTGGLVDIGIKIDPASSVSGIRVDDNEIYNFSGQAILAHRVRHFRIDHNYLHDIGNQWTGANGAGAAGVSILSGENGSVIGNTIKNIGVSPYAANVNAYGISVTLYNGETPSTDIAVSSNVVENIPSWHAYDTHCGQRVSFTGNTAFNVWRGVAVGVCTSPATAPTDVAVTGNVLTAGSTRTGTAAEGITFSGLYLGASDTAREPDLATGIISGNVVRYFGVKGLQGMGAISAYSTNGLVISSNTVYQPSPVGIMLYTDNYGFSVSGNTVIDPWTDSTGLQTWETAVAVTMDHWRNNGVIGNNTFRKTGFVTGVSVLLYGVGVNPNYGNSAVVSGNRSDTWPYMLDNAGTPAARTIEPRMLEMPVTQSALTSLGGNVEDGTIVYCSDCTSSCASGGTGALAKRIAGAWVCN